MIEFKFAGRFRRFVVTSAVSVVAAGLVASVHAGESSGAGEKVLRVCEDPNNLPLSHRNLSGFENKIAELLGKELGWQVEYTWFPQRMGFIRNTLRAKEANSDHYKCDLVMGVPAGYELTDTTKPYYRSTYAMVFIKGRSLDSVQTPDDLLRLDKDKLRSLKFGVFGQSPPVDWLLKHGLFGQAVSYQKQTGDPDSYPGEMINQDLVSGKIDVAFAWGPIAGYFAKTVTHPALSVVPFRPSPDIKFDFSISMGMRRGEPDFKNRIEQLIEKNRGKIQAILAEYGVPQLDEHGELLKF